MVNEQLTPDRRDEGSIGIGAMIVFIALILVAAVASTIIIKTAEELQQNAENTSSDTRQQISGKVSIADVYVKTVADSLGSKDFIRISERPGRRHQLLRILQGVFQRRICNIRDSRLRHCRFPRVGRN